MEEYIVNSNKVLVNLFNEIRSNEDAYLIGYLIADGSYGAGIEGKRKHRMAVSSTDHYIIEGFKNKYQPLTELKIKSPNDNPVAGIYGRKEYKLLTFSSLFSPYFEKFGIMSLKPEREIKNIPSEYFPLFILGLFDADGNISYGYRKDRNRLWANFRITHQSESLLNTVGNYLEEKGVNASIKKKGSENCFVLTVAKVQSVKSVYTLLYSKVPEIFNFEKKKKYLDLLNRT